MLTMMRKTLSAVALAGCSVGDGQPAASTASQAIESCGDLCSPDDSVVVPFDELVSYQTDEDQTLGFEAAAGTVRIDLDLWANAGSLEALEPEGVAVTIGSEPTCLSEIRYWYNDGCETHCVVTVDTVAGLNQVPIHLYQWNGTEGWKVNVESATVTLLTAD